MDNGRDDFLLDISLYILLLLFKREKNMIFTKCTVQQMQQMFPLEPAGGVL